MNHVRLCIVDSVAKSDVKEFVMFNTYGSIYLSGPMNNHPKEKQLYWRDVFHEACKSVGINTLSPMRSKNLLPPELYETNDSIMERDLYDVRQCDILVVNLLESTHVSMGTMIEMGVAWGLRKPIITIREPHNIHNSQMIPKMSAFEVKTLEDAFKVVAAMMVPDDEIKLLKTDVVFDRIINRYG